MKRILFVSVHPDDETLGCGGTILKLKAEGATVFWLNLTGGSLDHPYGFNQELLNEREEMIRKVSQAYCFDGFENLDYPTQMLDSVEPRLMIGKIKKAYDSLQADTLFLPNRSDIHSDHRIAFEALFNAAKNFRTPYVKQILMYETLSETEFAPALPEKAFIPNTFIDVSGYLEEKIKIMRLYDTELMPDPYPRSESAIKGLAMFRGSRIGVRYAEAFQMIYRMM